MPLVRRELEITCVKNFENFKFLLSSAGLIHANHGLTIMDYLSQELRTNNNEVCSVSNWSCDLNMILT